MAALATKRLLLHFLAHCECYLACHFILRALSMEGQPSA